MGRFLTVTTSKSNTAAKIFFVRSNFVSVSLNYIISYDFRTVGRK